MVWPGVILPPRQKFWTAATLKAKVRLDLSFSLFGVSGNVHHTRTSLCYFCRCPQKELRCPLQEELVCLGCTKSDSTCQLLHSRLCLQQISFVLDCAEAGEKRAQDTRRQCLVLTSIEFHLVVRGKKFKYPIGRRFWWFGCEFF